MRVKAAGVAEGCQYLHGISRVKKALSALDCQENMLLYLELSESVEVTSIPGEMSMSISKA